MIVWGSAFPTASPSIMRMNIPTAPSASSGCRASGRDRIPGAYHASAGRCGSRKWCRSTHGGHQPEVYHGSSKKRPQTRHLLVRQPIQVSHLQSPQGGLNQNSLQKSTGPEPGITVTFNFEWHFQSFSYLFHPLYFWYLRTAQISENCCVMSYSYAERYFWFLGRVVAHISLLIMLR